MSNSVLFFSNDPFLDGVLVYGFSSVWLTVTGSPLAVLQDVPDTIHNLGSLKPHPGPFDRADLTALGHRLEKPAKKAERSSASGVKITPLLGHADVNCIQKSKGPHGGSSVREHQ
jgi:hypothetical protein